MNLSVTEKDFIHLWDTSMEWGEFWREKSERFDPPISYHWKRAYWFYSYANLLVARSFLNEQGYETQTTFDDGVDSWLLLTDYNKEII